MLCLCIFILQKKIKNVSLIAALMLTLLNWKKNQSTLDAIIDFCFTLDVEIMHIYVVLFRVNEIGYSYVLTIPKNI